MKGRILTVVALSLAACACNPLRKIAADQGGGWWSVQVDTLVRERLVPVPLVPELLDTSFAWTPGTVDTVRTAGGRIATTVFIDRTDTVWRWRIRTEAGPDTVLVGCTDTVFIRSPALPVLPPLPENAPGWMQAAAFVVGMLGFVLIVIFSLRKKVQ